jgi:alkanesulfonate monooxygenase SsuD/methylene tetrahydromethanopterin reductase-like flavin-dependent oxidoreductase (luciferase family)
LCYRDEEFAGFRVDATTDKSRLEALASFLRGAFRGGSASIDGREVRITPSPLSPPGPMLMIAADGEDGADRAARLADMLMVDPTEPWAAVDAAVVRFDRARGDTKGRLVLFTYGGLSDDGREAAWAEVADGFRYMRHNYDRWMGREPTRELPPQHYRLLLGTPDEVATQVKEYGRRYGDRVHVVLRCNYPGMDAAAVTSQLRLWGSAAAKARSLTN